MKNIGFAGLSALTCLAFALPVFGQAAAQPPAAEVACNAKYTKYYGAQDNLTFFDDFVKDPTCKDSMYRESAFQLIMGKLIAGGKFKEASEIANRFGTEIPKPTDVGKKYILGNGLVAASQLGDADKIIDAGEKVLANDPNDLNALMAVAFTL